MANMLPMQSKVTIVKFNAPLTLRNGVFNLFAFALARVHTVAGKKGSIEGMVRVTNPVTSQRALIRGKSSEVLDLQFAHMKTQIMLASIEITALHIHKIETVNENIICTLLLKIENPVAGHVPTFDRVNWCPYVPENETESDSDAGKLLVWTRGATFQCYNVSTVVENYGVRYIYSFLVFVHFAREQSCRVIVCTFHVDFFRMNAIATFFDFRELDWNTSCERDN